MARKYFIGDKVETKYGIGWIRKVTSWRDRIVEMNDFEAVAFSNDCKRLCGINYKEDWVELLVEINGTLKDLQASAVNLLEGREYDSGK
ncbi:MAG: hypothetical protein P8Y23_09200 [Candidatus Lokiarchaeota archaeon]|jgi:hypothetical protein